jgi:hypothetical protein
MLLKEFFALLKIKVDDASFKKIDSALGTVADGLKWVAGVAVAGTAALGALVAHTADQAAEFMKLSQVMGVSVEQAQEWAFAMGQAGLSADDFMQLAAELAENVGEAAGGTGEAAEAFKSMGIKTKDAKGKIKEVGPLLEEIADKFAAMPDGQKKTAAAMGLFGEEGLKLLPILNQGSAAIGELRASAADLGIVLEEEHIRQGIDAKRVWQQFISVMESVAQAIAGPVIGNLLELSDAFFEWWSINQNLVKQRLSQTFAVLTAVLRVLWKVVVAVVRAFSFLLDNYAAIARVAGGILLALFVMQLKWHLILLASWIRLGAAAALAGLRTMLAWIAAAAPMIAMAALIVLLVLLFEDLYVWMTGGDSLIGSLWEKYKGFVQEWIQPKEGDGWLLKAFKLLLDLVLNFGDHWDRMISTIRNAWSAAVVWMKQTFWSMINEVIKGLNYALDFIPGFEDQTLNYHTTDEEAQAVAAVLAKGIGAVQNINWSGLGARANAGMQQLAAMQNNTKNNTLKAEITIDGSKTPEETAAAVKEELSTWWDGMTRQTKGAF